MPTRSDEKTDAFIDRLISLGYEVELINKKPILYSIDGKRVNIRSKTNPKRTVDDRKLFWYDITFNVLEEVKWVIYLAQDSYHFFMFPSNFLAGLRDRMYPNRKNAGVGVFDIDSSEGYLVLKDGDLEPAWDYEYNFDDPQYYPHF